MSFFRNVWYYWYVGLLKCRAVLHFVFSLHCLVILALYLVVLTSSNRSLYADWICFPVLHPLLPVIMRFVNPPQNSLRPNPTGCLCTRALLKKKLKVLIILKDKLEQERHFKSKGENFSMFLHIKSLNQVLRFGWSLWQIGFRGRNMEEKDNLM